MEPCLQLNQLQTDLCCWGRRPVVPIELYSFCSTHSTHFLEYVLVSFFGHAAKTALFVSTSDTFYILFKKDFSHYFVMAWKAKPLPLTLAGKKPLHFRKTSSGVLTQKSVVQLLEKLDNFELSCILQTPLRMIDALQNVFVPMNAFHVSHLEFDATVPAFVLADSTHFISPHVLSAPFVMLLNGSSTPDPRLYSNGTLNLWNTLTANRVQLSKLRHGVLLQQTKKLENVDDDFKKQYNDECTPPSTLPLRQRHNDQTKGDHEQFRCEL